MTDHEVPSRAATAPRFHATRRVRRTTRTHPYAYHIEVLPARLREVAAGLEVGPGARVLDYGCADVPYRDFFPDDVEDIPAGLPGNPQATLVLNPDGTLSVEDGTFDVVTSTQVLEHVVDPATYLAECARVLAP